MKTICQILLLIALGLTACRPPGPKVIKAVDVEDLPPFDPATQQTLTRLNIEHLEHFLESNPDAMLLDVRGLEDYDKGHLPGAVSFPYDFEKQSIQEQLIAHPDYDTKKVYLAYGSNKNVYSIEVMIRLASAGYQYLNSLNGGIEDWVKLGLPVESKEVVK